MLVFLVGGAGEGAAADGAAPHSQDQESAFWFPTLLGTSGLVVTPTADVIPGETILFGLTFTDKAWSYFDRGDSDNYTYFLTAGFLPRVEVSIHATYAPNDRLIQTSDNEGTNDRGASGRLLLLVEGDRRPGLAVGIDDVRGTRRFHSLYAVTSKGYTFGNSVLIRGSLGYGSDALDAKNYILNGVFGGGEIRYRETAGIALDYDTEKWNTSFRLVLFERLAAYAAFLDFKSPSGGISWFQRF
jgi:hypothetical protein